MYDQAGYRRESTQKPMVRLMSSKLVYSPAIQMRNIAAKPLSALLAPETSSPHNWRQPARQGLAAWPKPDRSF